MPDRDNFIITGNQAANYSQFVGGGGSTPFFSVSTIKYGRVVSVNLNDRSITYEKIQNNFGNSALNNPSKLVGYAKPFNPNFSRLPEAGELVPLIPGPTENIGSNGNSLNEVAYYLLGPIAVHGTVDDNKVLKDTPSPSPNATRDYKLNNIGITPNRPLRPQPTPSPSSAAAPYLASRQTPAQRLQQVLSESTPLGEELPDEKPATLITAADGSWDSLNRVINSIYNNRNNWTETGANPNIIETFKVAGKNNTSDKGIGNSWCASFVSYVLNRAGLPYLKTRSSQAYKKYGTEVPLNDPTKWRKWDLVILQNKSDPDTGHITFLYDGITTSKEGVAGLGGNQSNTVKISLYPYNDELRLVAIRRGKWVPPSTPLSPASTQYKEARPNIL
jgi:hypothetical protein